MKNATTFNGVSLYFYRCLHFREAPSSEGHDNPAMEMEENEEVKTDDKKTEEEEEEETPKETTSL